MDGVNETASGLTFINGLISATDLRLKQYCAVKRHSTHNSIEICGAGGVAVGVLYNAPDAGQVASVRALDGSFGWLEVDASTILEGSLLKSDAAGLGTVTTSDNDVVIARAMEASSTAHRIQVQYTANAPRY